MRLLVTFLVAFLVALAVSSCTPAPPSANSGYQLFLLAGQSNMAGRGGVADEDRTAHPRVLALSKEDMWMPAAEPLHFDKPIAGVGPGKAFGAAIADAFPADTIGLIPSAVGGSPVAAWRPGAYYAPTDSHPYDDALRRLSAALPNGELKAVLWHQGESDSRPELAPAYRDELAALIDRFRAAAENPDLPILIGQLGRFQEKPWDQWRSEIDRIHRELADADPFVIYVSSEGLSHKGDTLHFDAASSRALGRRFAEAYLSLVNPQ